MRNETDKIILNIAHTGGLTFAQAAEAFRSLTDASMRELDEALRRERRQLPGPPPTYEGKWRSKLLA